jgi:deoxyribonuclease V
MASNAPLHTWDLDTSQARELQLALAGSVNTTHAISTYSTVGGADVSYNKRGRWLYAALVVLRSDTLEVLDHSGAVCEVTFPYVPGLLSFRETPAVLQAFAGLRVRPEVLLCDGQGIAHPRRMGLASHLGLWLGIPTVGCAKSWLFGEYQEPGPNRGDWAPLSDKGQTIGSGHLCDLTSAISVVLATTRTYRLPVPSRLAHQFVNALRLEEARP